MKWTALLPFSPGLGWVPMTSGPARAMAAIVLPTSVAPVTIDILLKALAARVKALAAAAPPGSAELALRALDRAGMLDGMVWTTAARADPLTAAIRHNPAVRRRMSALDVTADLPGRATPGMLAAVMEDEELQDLDAWLEAATGGPPR